MRLLYILAFTSLLSAPAFAADLGTYRPGSPYHSVVAPGADVCDSHCAGDAQCKGWNYVKVNPRAPGVCEFNAKDVSPIESAISISGTGGASIAPNLLQGNTNTIRVGTSQAPRAKTRTVTVGKTPSGRRIVRESVPQRVKPSQTIAPRPAQTGSLTAQQNKYRQATGHAAPQTFQPQTRQPQTRQPQARPQGYPQQQYQQQAPRSQQQATRPQMRQQQVAPQGQRLMRDPRIQLPQQQRGPRLQHNLDGAPRAPQNMMVRPRQQQPQQQYQGRQAPQQQTYAPQGRPPIGVPIGGKAQAQAQRTAPLPQQRAIPRGSVNDPVTHSNGAQRVEAAVQRQAQMSYEQAQQSLFGSLNDDVQAPRPLMSAPLDPNAPIPTSQARPTQPVTQGTLGGLAGAPGR
ncbi:MAG: hypothetical protein ABJN69_17310 [Hellea sp.]